MRRLYFLLLFFLSFENSFCQKIDQASIRRIADYGKLWAIVTLFHPEMAYNRINADSLFTENISDLVKDPTAKNFKDAVGRMLHRLGDPYTTLQSPKAPDSIQLLNYPLLKWIDDSVAMLHFDLQFINQSFTTPSLSSMIDTLKNAKGIIVDLREPFAPDDFGSYSKARFFSTLTGRLIDRPVSSPAYRTRIHYGHESETFTSEFYYQGWLLQNGSVVNPAQKVVRKPLCLLINKHDNFLAGAVIALQKAGMAKVLADGNLDDFEPYQTYPLDLSDSIKVNIRLSEIVYPDGSKEFTPNVTIRKNSSSDDTIIHAAISLIKDNIEDKKAGSRAALENHFVSAKVAGYENLPYPPASLRLLGLMRYWSAINYFCPNKNLITKNWDSVLYEYTPLFLLAKDSLQYALTAARLIKEINDGHGFFYSPMYGKMISNSPEVQLAYIEKKSIVYKVFNDSLKKILSTGDELIAVNNVSVTKWRDSVGQYIGASNDAALQRDITRRMLDGEPNSFVTIRYLHNGATKTAKLSRTVLWSQFYYNSTTSEPEPVWKKMGDKLGYVDFGRLEVAQIDSMFLDLSNTDAIIIDNRSYPRGTVWALINHLTDKPVKSARGTTIIADSPTPGSETVQGQIWELPITPKPQYKGRLIILVNEVTQSQAEYSCMVMQAASKKITIIGSQTAGADGDVTGILLPGGIRTSFSGHGVYYPDGRPTQGIGIVPDITIKPTISGIKAGKDEVLDRAILFARTGK
jgi:C-terminal processing protease CtpA/Prc